jgi:hypothetical protein
MPDLTPTPSPTPTPASPRARVAPRVRVRVHALDAGSVRIALALGGVRVSHVVFVPIRMGGDAPIDYVRCGRTGRQVSEDLRYTGTMMISTADALLGRVQRAVRRPPVRAHLFRQLSAELFAAGRTDLASALDAYIARHAA